MSTSKIPFTITYKRPGTTPPLYLAGSFSDPEWHPNEMEYKSDKDGEYVFQYKVMVETGKEYQFKLRVGQSDWWVLSDEYATATDDSGNKNNILNVPSSQLYQNSGDASTHNPLVGDESRSTMPVIEVQDPSAEEGMDDTDDLQTPLFAHECLGAYDFPDDESEEEACPSIPMGRYMDSKSTDYDRDAIDTNDPTLEKFPSDRGSIMDALRTIQTNLSEDQTHLKDIPASPRVVSSGRSSIDSTDEMSLSPVPLSPSTTRRREQRLSHSSFRRSRSVVSLGSIAEEDTKPEEADQEEQSPGQLSPDAEPSKAPPIITMPNPNTTSAREERRSPPSEEDEAVVMKGPRATTNGKDGKMAPIPTSDDFVPDQASQESKIAAGVASETVTEINLQANVHQAKAPSEPLKLNETDSSNSDATQNSAPNKSDRAVGSDPNPRPDVVKDHNRVTVSKWLHVLLTGVQRNKLHVILATGAVAVAMGLRWWNGFGQ